ncbi:sensor histidine kinase [Halobacteriovorax sp. YZS-1-1]|uniref:sensor histidine kinase n=1 Tax=unclassified Halobacteriovorax TaxID=2639665 RepID=UPI00399B0F1A
MNVSNKAVHAYINYIIENNDDPKSFFENLGYDYSVMSDEKKYMSWDDYKVITESLNDKYDKFYEGMTRHGLTNKFVKHVLDILSRMISFRFVGDFILKYSFKTFYTNAVSIELIKKGRTTFDIKLAFNSEDDIFPVFVDMYRDVFLALPRLISNSLTWDVKTSQNGNILIYHIDEKMSSPSFYTSFQFFILRIFKLDKYYQTLIFDNLQHSNELEKKNIELELAEKKISEAHKDVLLANRIISHDIANKMQIIEHVKRLMKRNDIEKANQKLDIYYKSVKAIIENTRNVIDDHSSSFMLADVSLKNLLEELVFEYQDQANNKDVNISFNLECEDNYHFRTNKEALKASVLGNILQNAIKFSKANSEIKISASVEKDILKISCEDSGVGIERSLVNDINHNSEKLFQSTIGTHGETGRGLGLFIIRKVCRELDFNVKFESSLGNGTKVTISKTLQSK